MSAFPHRALAFAILIIGWSGAVSTATAAAYALQESRQTVEVPFRDSRLVAIAGASQVVVVEDQICQAEIVAGGVRFHGLLQGETVAFVWVGEQRMTLLVRVVALAPVLARPSLSPEELEQIGQGQLGSNGQMVVDPSGARSYDFQHLFQWSQQVTGRRLSVRGQARHTSRSGTRANIDGLSVQYTTPNSAYTFVDFGLNLDGGEPAKVTNYSAVSPYTFRGADAAWTRGASQLEVFAGTTIPSNFRSIRGTNRIAGVKFNRQLSPAWYAHTTTAAISVMPAGIGVAPVTRTGSVFHMSGLSYRPGDRWSAQATGGASNGGLYGDAGLAFSGDQLSVWTTWTGSSPEFALNQLRLLSGGGSYARAGAIWKNAARLTASLTFQRSDTRPTSGLSAFSGHVDYLNPNVSVRLSPSNTVTLNGIYSLSRGGVSLGGRTVTRTLDAGWTSQWMGRITNTAQVAWTSSEDPQQFNNGARISLRESVSVGIKGGFLSAGYQHSANDPSLVTRLRQQIGLLSPSQQERFLTDPIGFTQSPDLPQDVRDLLNAIRDASSQFTLSGQFRVGRRLNLSANYGLMKSSQASNNQAINTFGYALAYQLAPSLQVLSSLSDTYVLNSKQDDLVRTTTFQLGLHVGFRGGPAWLAPASPDYHIEGRVFVDRNTSGTSDADEQGLAGIEVRLDDGSRVVSDAAGRFRFSGLRPGRYRVSMALDQFRDPVRMTTLTSMPVDLFDNPQATVEFGVVDFSRVMGTVFNDYLMDGLKAGDAPGLPRIGLLLTGPDNAVRRVSTDGAGDYRIDDLAPGTYRIGIDPSTIPPDFIGVAEATTFDVKAIQTVVVDLPLRALRSVAGFVYITQGTGETATLLPAVGVTVIAAGRRSTTDATGHFILRNLPAGDIVVTLESGAPLPEGMTMPTGTLRLPKEPTTVDNATIVIRNPALAGHLTGKK